MQLSSSRLFSSRPPFRAHPINLPLFPASQTNARANARRLASFSPMSVRAVASRCRIPLYPALPTSNSLSLCAPSPSKPTPQPQCTLQTRCICKYPPIFPHRPTKTHPENKPKIGPCIDVHVPPGIRTRLHGRRSCRSADLSPPHLKHCFAIRPIGVLLVFCFA